METTAILDPIEISSVDEHRIVRHHMQRHHELEAKLREATAHHSALCAKRTQADRERHNATVNHHLCGTDPPADDSATLAQLDAEIDQTRSAEAAIQNALELHDTIAAGVRRQVQQEVDQHIAAAAAVIVNKMTPMAEQLAGLNQQLMTLASQRSSSDVLVPSTELFAMWLAQLRAIGGR